MQPDDYAITAYDAAMVIIDAVKRVAATRQAGDPRGGARRNPDVAASRHCRERSSFDENGDIEDRIDQRVPDHSRTRETLCKLDDLRQYQLHRGGAGNPDRLAPIGWAA